jgi:hypothetical protein
MKFLLDGLVKKLVSGPFEGEADAETRSIRVITTAGDDTQTKMIRWLPAGASQPFEMDVQAFFSRAIGPVVASHD